MEAPTLADDATRIDALLRRVLRSARGMASSRRRIAAIVLGVAALLLAIDAGWIHAKAAFAQQLLHGAWSRSQQDGLPHPPWPWADTHPVARLQLASRNIDQIVLAGDSGRTLAFGPGWAEASVAPGARGTLVISGHRDTHFAFLRDVQVGEIVSIESADAMRRYRITGMRVADSRVERIASDGDDALVLVTCWPFDAVVAGGPMRYVVRAEPVG
jgi:sortase A